MRILYDGSVYAYQQTGGISRYFTNLIRHLPQSAQPSLIVSKRRKLSFPSHENLRVTTPRGFMWPKPFRGLGKWLGKRSWNRLYETGDVLHPTYYTLLSQQQLSTQRLPIVLTVYDMIHERFREICDADGSVAKHKALAIRAAQAIICISHRTKEDLLEFFPSEEARVSVVHLASELGSVTPAPTVFTRPYFLYVGSRVSYKNFDRLLQAMAIVASKRRDVCLCTVGPPFCEREKEEIRKLRLEASVVNCGHADDSKLARLYRSSIALVYPTLYEGFGIPPLEAMSCGSAVLASNSSSIPEVVGNAAMLFDPTSTDNMAHAMLSVLDDPSQRLDLVTKGGQRAKLFSWRKTADQTMSVYQSVLQATMP